MGKYEAATDTSDRRRTLASEEYVTKTMPPILGTLDMTATYLVVVFFIVNAPTAATGGPAAFTYLILGAVTFFIPCAIATAQLGSMFPHEGSLYNWTHQVLGGYWSFFIGFCAWFPGVLVIVSGADIAMAYIQGLNSNWLIEPWQQGAVIVGIIIAAYIISIQRFRMVQNVINLIVGLMAVAVFLIGISSVIWLATGHPSLTSFNKPTSWGINPGNYYLFGLITLAYLGTEVPLNMGGEIVRRRVITRHLFWGTLLVLLGYFVATFSVLVVRGTSVSAFDLVTLVDMVLGKVASRITVICIICSFIAVPIVYNYAFARLLMVAGIDQRLPYSVGKLNKHRVPANAMLFQACIALAFAALTFFVAPYVINLGKPADLASEVYNVSQAAVTLVWAISTAFFFINLVILYARDRRAFHRQRIFPMPVLWASVVIGPIACILAIVDSLLNSWIPQIDNQHWWLIVGGLTAACLIIAAIGSMFASSEAAWESMSA